LIHRNLHPVFEQQISFRTVLYVTHGLWI
jgi:hypothetical protein